MNVALRPQPAVRNILSLCAGVGGLELDFKYNTRKETDGERTRIGIGRIEGKRLMYKSKAAG